MNLKKNEQALTYQQFKQKLVCQITILKDHTSISYGSQRMVFPYRLTTRELREILRLFELFELKPEQRN
ncbi:MAG: hypothetical protein ACE5I1_03925 [bacterium]